MNCMQIDIKTRIRKLDPLDPWAPMRYSLAQFNHLLKSDPPKSQLMEQSKKCVFFFSTNLPWR